MMITLIPLQALSFSTFAEKPNAGEFPTLPTLLGSQSRLVGLSYLWSIGFMENLFPLDKNHSQWKVSDF